MKQKYTSSSIIATSRRTERGYQDLIPVTQIKSLKAIRQKIYKIKITTDMYKLSILSLKF